ncbi:hypothetical protein HXX01_05230 [Candidatus Nomurabacteria bacterium]|nr:hypothetical protein [Candidatus Nomurabacteria bacterium]
MSYLTSIKEILLAWRDERDIKKYQKVADSIEQENDPLKKLENIVLIELRGTLLGGMASSTAYMEFKRNYFDKITSVDGKENVKKVLLNILKSNEYKSSDKEMVAYACADIVILEAIPEIENLLRTAKKGSIAEKEFARSLEALRLGKPIYEYILQGIKA